MHHNYQIPLHRLLWHALRLRCPYCGKGRLFSHGYTMNDHCSFCGWKFEREEGYWIGAVAINLGVAEMLAAAAAIPLAIMQVSPLLVMGIGIPLVIALPFLFYRHSKSFWMALDFMIHPVSLNEMS
ncbi:MAG TPA: DUF983 domain-containing protein [Ktedonobacterales bacterium]|nr:DUF983 domain-containing protein [Ktedonobacterales bacterium]